MYLGLYFLSIIQWNATLLRIREKKIITALWNLWNERNNIREEGRRRSAELIARTTNAYVAEAESTLKSETNITVGGPARRSERWSKPQPGSLKLNCDGSLLAAWGFFIRQWWRCGLSRQRKGWSPVKRLSCRAPRLSLGNSNSYQPGHWAPHCGIRLSEGGTCDQLRWFPWYHSWTFSRGNQVSSFVFVS